ncbi:hypothetical protein [uncultured Gammaproteobacteria bacterium]|jgi:hypothetical protein|nr:hypothetical protein [uncultured Gammaproteobacteria bacterium]CAC9642636.1 hypothetical protein [uncultured Gammaproteobacteria bacterium]VVH51815.1 hypothetical protein BPUTSESOX_78 [uncultured Gammaproteobacteria bacterium]
MTDDLILSFPVLKNGGGDFLDNIYVVEAKQNSRKLYITHTLKGNSFIFQLIKDKKAKFSVSLFYKDNAERQKFICEDFDCDDETNEITAKQTINIDFKYAPEITPNIVIFEETKITVDNSTGLSDFWRGETFTIPAYARIAHYLKLTFNSGDVSSLLNISCDETFTEGLIKTVVSEIAGEGEKPIKVICAKDVFDELKKGAIENPNDAKTAMRASIVTQILCHVYAYMSNLDEDGKEKIHSGLLTHMEMVKERTGEDWGGELNASFAATKMQPYAIRALNEENN